MLRSSFPLVARRCCWVIVCFIMMTLFVVLPRSDASATQQVQTASANVSTGVPCIFVPPSLGQLVCNQITENGLPVPNPIDVMSVGVGAATNVAQEAADSMFSRIAEGLFASVADYIRKGVALIDEGTQPNFFKKWFIDLYGWAFALAIALGMPAALLRTSKAAKEGDAVDFVKGPILITILIAAGGLIPAAVGAGVFVFDGPTTDGIVNLAGNDMDKVLTNYQQSIVDNYDFGEALFGPMIIAFFGLLGGVIMWLQFQLREYALYIVTAWEVVVFGLWVAGKALYKRFAQTTITLMGLIVFKALAAVLLLIGTKMVSDPGESKDPIVIGSALLILFPFILWGAYKGITRYDPQPARLLLIYKVARR